MLLRRLTLILFELARTAEWLVLIGSAALALVIAAGGTEGELPWIRLDLAQPMGRFTAAKLARLHGDPARCGNLLRAAGVRFTALPAHADVAACRFDDGVRLDEGGTFPVSLRPAAPILACPLAAALAMWTWNVIEPAAERTLGSRVVAIDHYGSFNCRRIARNAAGDWSEHATADAIDVAAFRLADGRRIGVAEDWRNGGASGAFLHQVRDGGCRLFATVLSPDYNAAHHDHLHLDEAARGAWEWRVCH